MGVLRPAVRGNAFLKAGIMGFQASGKSHTAMLIALGLAKRLNTGIAFFDTETGSDYWVGRVAEQKVPFFQAKTRSFTDLLAFIKECEDQKLIGIIDSLTHVWTSFTRAYMERTNRKRLEFQDWAKLKEEWAEFTTRYLNSAAHLIFCGRSGFEYDTEVDEDGNRELIKTGTKMKTETETGYEPSLLIEMTRVKLAMQGRVKIKNTKKTSAPDVNKRGWVNRATVIKDRFDLIDGKEFDAPTYESFLPHIDMLNLGGEHVGVDVGRSAQDRELFEDPDRSGYARRKQCEVICEEILDGFVKAEIGGTSQANRKEVIRILEAAFGTSAWSAIKDFAVEKLKEGKITVLAECYKLKPEAFPDLAPRTPNYDELPAGLAPDALARVNRAVDSLNGEDALEVGLASASMRQR